MIVCTIVLTLPKKDRRKVISSLLPLVGSTRVQPGCQVCFMLTDVDDPRVLVLWEEWDTRENLERHLRSSDYRLVLAAMELSQVVPQINFNSVNTRSGIEVVEAARMPR